MTAKQLPMRIIEHLYQGIRIGKELPDFGISIGRSLGRAREASVARRRPCQGQCSSHRGRRPGVGGAASQSRARTAAVAVAAPTRPGLAMCPDPY